MIRLVDKPFDPHAQLASFTRRAEGAGAVASFIGLVRGENGVTALELQSHAVLTAKEISSAVAEARARWSLIDALVVHRVGRIAVGEAIVLVAIAAAHRRAAFAACEFLTDFLKTDAPLWKKESGANGERWIEPRAEDCRDRGRWKSPPASPSAPSPPQSEAEGAGDRESCSPVYGGGGDPGFKPGEPKRA